MNGYAAAVNRQRGRTISDLLTKHATVEETTSIISDCRQSMKQFPARVKDRATEHARTEGTFDGARAYYGHIVYGYRIID